MVLHTSLKCKCGVTKLAHRSNYYVKKNVCPGAMGGSTFHDCAIFSFHINQCQSNAIM